MGQRRSANARAKRGPWKRDVMPDRSTAHPGRGGTVGGGEYCAARTAVSKHTNDGRNEITVVPGRTVGDHRLSLVTTFLSLYVAVWPHFDASCCMLTATSTCSELPYHILALIVAFYLAALPQRA